MSSAADGDAPGRPSIERRIAAHPDGVALVILALGLVARLRAARSPFVTPDELLHLRLAASPGLWATYRASLGNAHPPLFFLLLHGWRRVVETGWQLRLLPVACGTAFLWAAYRWAASTFGLASGLITLAFLSFLPSVVLVSSELRGYALLLLLIAAALCALERAFSRKSPAGLGLFTLLAALALLTHYVAIRFIAAAFAYAAARIAIDRPPRRFMAAWAAGQAALAALLAFLFASHLSHLRGSSLEREAQTTWLRESYRSAPEGPLRFLGRQTLALFQFLFSSPAAGAVALILFLGGAAWLALRRRPPAILLGVPFVLAAVGGLLALYPYGATRHSADLALFASAGTSVALARLSGERLWVAVAVAAVLVAAGFAVSG